MITLRTHIDTGTSPERITYSDPVLFIGSCFASEIGSMFKEGKMPVMINPAGTVFNPVSVLNTLESIITDKAFKQDDLYYHGNTWMSLAHYTEFSSHDPLKVLEKINTKTNTAHNFLLSSRYLFITFGTARAYILKETGNIVSNCHKLPSGYFDSVLLKVDDIVRLWSNRLTSLKEQFPELKVIFTISPVRHWKDGAHGNQVSKSVLFLAIEELLKHPAGPGYFPAYEILMDELRDYRFYADDMLHPSSLAVNYIWEKFAGCYLDQSTLQTWKEASKITLAMKHRLTAENIEENRKFADKMLSRIDRIESGNKIDFSVEKKYFQSLLK